MAAQIPIKNNPSANTAAMDKVKADKYREVKAGHDGTWVAHPDLANIAMDIFNAGMTTPNQLFVRREDVHVRAQDLLNTNIPGGKITEKGIKENIEVGLLYCEAWLRGIGCSPINNLMEDAATAEISVPPPRRYPLSHRFRRLRTDLILAFCVVSIRQTQRHHRRRNQDHRRSSTQMAPRRDPKTRIQSRQG